jgi:hypothetical protein
MANGSNIKTIGKTILLYRGYTPNGSLSSTQYLAPTKFKVGVNNTTPLVSKTDLDYPVPIEDGRINDDGSNTLTGSNGGDNTTDNTTTYKEGAGNTDNTAQNLITTGSNTTKTWTISNLATAGTVIDDSKYCGLWIYIKDATALAKFKTSGTCLEIKLGSDSSNYYSETFEVSDLSVGWNWLSLGIVSDLTETGTVSGSIDTFIIDIITNNAADDFVAGDVIYDLLRIWEYSDTVQSFVSGYPSLDTTNNEVTTRGYLNSLKANGFDINGVGVVNEDTIPLMFSEDTITSESKSLTDEFIIIDKDRVI